MTGKGKEQLLDLAIQMLEKLDKKNIERPMVGDLFCESIPGYMPRPSVTEIPNLSWKCSNRDLMVLPLGLNELKAITDGKGQPISFTTLIKNASTLLEAELKQPFRIQNEILKRVSNKDTFLERMEGAMRSTSRKKR